MNTVYDRKYQNLALDIAKESGYESFIRQGCYCMFSGPTYETIAELKLAVAVSLFYLEINPISLIFGTRLINVGFCQAKHLKSKYKICDIKIINGVSVFS